MDLDRLFLDIFEQYAKLTVAHRFIHQFGLSPDDRDHLMTANDPDEMRDLAKSMAQPLDPQAAVEAACAIVKGA